MAGRRTCQSLQRLKTPCDPAVAKMVPQTCIKNPNNAADKVVQTAQKAQTVKLTAAVVTNMHRDLSWSTEYL